MHAAAYAFVQQCRRRIKVPVGVVVELGSRDVNGTVRPLFADADRYIGVDLLPGPGVDVVCDAAQYRPETPPDVVLCLEVLEHTPDARRIVENGLRMLRPGGYLILTCAGPGRAPHSALHGGPLAAGEHYRNLHPWQLVSWLTDPGICSWAEVTVQVDHQLCDLRVLAHKERYL